ncbi:bifunctional tRNA (5-methylaminomethyl-2-thiouridine)(34)-methyltransferase MnmD/FAD-dependent 5-carboxymethylaminomethyl-2-thiouridine(34) oxidoreductase MnmC [Campylobacter sp. MIT 99-7217]|uniref:bifunctional tRNA (5-methylaminomethyl-2-thiouridine)(34)-methyltransferase MnmD/FAD-dependent 5-carboxymethylaminomethyl-2-thiouridine(34) oxidoreductase MnmC n=1 Tax=Campylobacter sp. MIT 99-7217 TaxID=535091 RepID=UPI00115B2292|nr:bifunctional tRNA (5-methylaminomethyl-2-thiouridine)(34)-methyltransferase MnmD/FAD-dependent 5-carboxymethylaminomethyl-2-thiouridine(34) oxidoreductase MnmC [Campylobacter sp. MIT 99-7217]TQR33780.1 bifunctional tRNA (5-methylaminomethyl-2-thiouridine)(34)-methyltransferase MnmD/FAD-dependent 5-carboxymethylaminomethyl-2-thiouridine(34) oxidoreductase MnmC [Campylobacter sp. MIT 99-7217]
MQKASLIFKDNTPYSTLFEDFYFNSKEGIEESEFVYTKAFEFEQKDTFIIAELGFGIGLNFFLTLQRFLGLKNRPKKLFYVSLEGFYLSCEELLQSYKKLGIYEKFKDFLEPFLKAYPKCKDGMYRFYFEDCFLDLVFADARKGIKELDFKADVWYLDGFSPRTNPTLFDEDMIKEVARLSKKGTQICTFSASSLLRKALEKYNFKIQKLQGFRKRQMIRAFFEGFEFDDTQAYFARTKPRHKNKKVAIIGAGIAGASLAFELGLRGFEVSVFDKKADLNLGASANEAGILSSLILKEGVSLGEFSQSAFYEASRFYKRHLKLELNGVYEFAYSNLMKERFLSQDKNPLFRIEDDKAFLEDGGMIKPSYIVKELFKKSKAKLYFSHEFLKYGFENGVFELFFKQKASFQGFDILIYAMGADSKDFINFKAMNLSKVRGQLTHLKPFLNTPYPLSSKGYICPICDTMQVIGATYDRLNQDQASLKSDDEQNIKNIQEFIKDDISFEVIGSRVAFRSYSSDRFAIIGSAYDENLYLKTYKSLLWSKNKAQVPVENDLSLYFAFGFGSRGFATAILGARYLCALINDEPLGILKSFVKDIHPARFLIRELKKGKI